MARAHGRRGAAVSRVSGRRRGITTRAHDARRRIEDEVGPVDILVDNAGITRDANFKKLDKVNWDAVIRTNLDFVFNMTKSWCDGMIERGWGRIINVSSVIASKGGFGQANYAAAKAGVHGFTKALALEVARAGVTVNTISPGYIATRDGDGGAGRKYSTGEDHSADPGGQAGPEGYQTEKVEADHCCPTWHRGQIQVEHICATWLVFRMTRRLRGRRPQNRRLLRRSDHERRGTRLPMETTR